SDAVHAGEVHEQVGLTEETRRPARSGSMLRAACRVDKDPAVAETEPAEELSGEAYAVLVDGVERARLWIVGGRVVAGCLVEPDVVPERTEAEEVVCRLPRVAAERVPDEVAGDDDARHRARGRRPQSGARRRPRHGSTPRRRRGRGGRRARSRPEWRRARR